MEYLHTTYMITTNNLGFLMITYPGINKASISLLVYWGSDYHLRSSWTCKWQYLNDFQLSFKTTHMNSCTCSPGTHQLSKCQSRQLMHWDTFKQGNHSTVGGDGDVGSVRYEPALLPPSPTIRVLSYSNCQRSFHSSSRAWQFRCKLICHPDTCLQRI